MSGRKRRKTPRRPSHKRSYIFIAVSVVLIVLFIFSIFLPVSENEVASRIFGAGGTLGIFVTFAFGIMALKDIFDHEYDFLIRLLALVFPAISLILWGGMYMVGIINS